MADSPKPRSRSSSRSRGAATPPADGQALDPVWLAEVEQLSFQEARTALELAMAQLQSDALEVEEMAGLYRRAEAYAKRCETVLQQVEQEVIEWDTDAAPTSR
jgi:exodeoxyribonuclease VII small subunit